MHWTAKIIVALLNVAWVFFFLQPDPFSVFVQKRSSDEEMVFLEFCIHLQSGMEKTSTPHSDTSITLRDTNMLENTNTTSEGMESSSSTPEVYPIKEAKLQPVSRCNDSCVVDILELENSAPVSPDHIVQDQTTPASPAEPGVTLSEVTTDSGWTGTRVPAAPDLEKTTPASPEEMSTVSFDIMVDSEWTGTSTLAVSDQYDRTPASPDDLRVTSSEVTMDSGLTQTSTSAAPDSDKTTPASPDEVGAASSDVSTDSGLSRAPTSAAPLLTNIHHPTTTVPHKKKKKKNKPENRGRRVMSPPNCCFTFSGPLPKRIIKSYQKTDPSCPKKGIILVTRNGMHICTDSYASWVQKIIEHLEQ